MNYHATNSARFPFARAVGIDRTSGEAYKCPELGNTCHRAGALAAFTAPSRMGDTLRHRDGTVTDLNGQPVGASK